MDHVPSPRHPIAPLPQVPLLCENQLQPYDGGDFMTYPLRAGYPRFRKIDGDHLFKYTEFNCPIDVRKLQGFCQSWVFFGLLHQVLAPYALFNASDFIESSKNDRGLKVVHTRNLPKKLAQWQSIQRIRSREQRWHDLSALQQSLEVAGQVTDGLVRNRRKGYDRSVTLSLMLLNETLGWDRGTILRTPEDPWKSFAGEEPFLLETDEVNLMAQHGWCPMETHSAFDTYVLTMGRVYLSRLRRPQLTDLQHERCDDNDGCHHLQLNPETYKMSHAKHDCRCGLVGPDSDEVARVLRDGSFPVLRVIGNETHDVRLKVVPARENVRYVAISHVWADGLGNPQANVLHRCQLLRMRRLMRGIQRQESMHNSSSHNGRRRGSAKGKDPELFLWLDSLCCPVFDRSNPDLKSLAISKLRAVYETASSVLVLDRTLEAISYSDIDALEAGIRIISSRWMRRLWTFQEGGLAQTLLIQFADRAVDFQLIWLTIRARRDDNLACLPLLDPVWAICANFQSWFDHPKVTLSQIDYRWLVRWLCGRRVSFAEDEPVCIAGAMGLDTGAVFATGPGQAGARMQTLWRLVSRTKHGISACVIFARARRLPMRGFRWAPATFQQPLSGNPSEFILGSPDEPAGQLVEQGLRVSFAGARIRLRGPPPSVPTRCFPFDDFDSVKMPYLRCRDAAGNWFRVFSPGRDQSFLPLVADRSKDWHIILERPTDGASLINRRALLVFAEAGEHNSTVFRTVLVLRSFGEVPFLETMYEPCYAVAQRLRRDWKIRGLCILTALHSGIQGIQMRTSSASCLLHSILTRRLVVSWGRQLVRQLQGDIQQASHVIAGMPSATRHMDMSRDAAAKIVSTDITAMFMGGTIDMLGASDSTRTWIVD